MAGDLQREVTACRAKRMSKRYGEADWFPHPNPQDLTSAKPVLTFHHTEERITRCIQVPLPAQRRQSILNQVLTYRHLKPKSYATFAAAHIYMKQLGMLLTGNVAEK